LIIIRYEDGFAHYDRLLKKAVISALKIKEDASFNILSVTPMKNNPKKNEIEIKKGWVHANKIKNKLLDYGVKSNKIVLNHHSYDLISEDEIHVFVE